MAGGENAAIVPCLKCAERADRISEGQEDDYYRCQTCGYEFGIDWSYEGPPSKPCWPISAEEAKTRRKMAAQVFGMGSAKNQLDDIPGKEAADKSLQKSWWKFWGR